MAVLALSYTTTTTTMDPSFKELLASNSAPPKLLKKLEKEDITNKTTLSVLTDSDLASLQKKHKLPMGHVVILRSCRDSLRRGGDGNATSRTAEISRAGDKDVLGPTVEKDVAQGSAATSPRGGKEPSPFKRPSSDEIRNRYQLPGGHGAVGGRPFGKRDQRSVATPPRNGASAVPSATPSPQLPDEPRTLASDAGATRGSGGGGLQAAAQMKDLQRKGHERGEKISIAAEKSRGLANTAMDYEAMCAQLAEKHRGGGKKKKKEKKKKKHKDEPIPPPTTTSDQDKTHYNSDPEILTVPPTHTLPPSRHRRSRRASQSPPHTSSTLPPPLSPPAAGPHSDPIRSKPSQAATSYGTIKDRSRSTTPTSLSFTSGDERLHLHYDDNEEEEPAKDTTRLLPNNEERRNSKLCSCCRTM